MTTNVNNSYGLKFRKSSCIGYLVCNNSKCDFLRSSFKYNETEWCGYIAIPFQVGEVPPKDSTVVCKICKFAPHSVSNCDARIYYVFSKKALMTKACIHLGNHIHHVALGTCRESLDTISGLIANEVSKTPTATTLAIALAATS